MTNVKTFPERLSWARAEAGLTQRELAEKSGISIPQIARYEGGLSKPRLGAALKLARVLGMDAYDLMPELRKTTKEIEVQLSAEEAEQFDAEAAKLGITTEELMRKLTMIGLRMKAKDPATRKMLEEEFPGMLERIDALSGDDD